MSKFLGLKKLTKEDFKLGDEIVIGGEVYVKKQMALSDEEIADLWANKAPQNELECVRLVEKAHGIGEQK